MANLRTASAVPPRPTSAHNLSRRLTRRLVALNVGADHVAAVYLDPDRVRARRAELVATGYPAHVATLAVRLEGRENTLLDLVDTVRLPRYEDELETIQALLWSLHQEHRAPVGAKAAAGCEA